MAELVRSIRSGKAHVVGAVPHRRTAGRRGRLVEVYVDGVVLQEVLEVITVAAGFGSICVWLHVNRIAFDLDKGRRRGWLT